MICKAEVPLRTTGKCFVLDTLGNYDFYDTENEQKGLLFGDFTVSRVRNALYRKVINRNADLTSQFNSLTQIGINIGSGGKLSFDQSKFGQALTNDPDAVEALFTFKETETDEDTNEVTITKAGIGVSIDELLADLTESDGTVQNKLDLIADQIEANKTRIEDLDESLARKRANLEAEFAAMEIALAQLQSQSQSILGLQALAAQSG